uniref:RNA exonuclease 4 n=1 Tax=Parastrongyloides trichosuri TaxID=131310 RepID=A0A0N5A237_PARTI
MHHLPDSKQILLADRLDEQAKNYLLAYDFTNQGGYVNVENISNIIAIDCEFVGIGEKGKGNALARVSIVNDNCEPIYDKYVKVNAEIKDYRTSVSGIKPEHLESGEQYNIVREEVCAIIHGRIIVGHDISSDLKVLNIKSIDFQYIRDTAYFPGFNKYKERGKRTSSLKDLMKKIFRIEIQDGSHDSVEDAASAMELYNKHKCEFEKRFLTSRYKPNILRSLKNFENSN